MEETPRQIAPGHGSRQAGAAADADAAVAPPAGAPERPPAGGSEALAAAPPTPPPTPLHTQLLEPLQQLSAPLPKGREARDADGSVELDTDLGPGGSAPCAAWQPPPSYRSARRCSGRRVIPLTLKIAHAHLAHVPTSFQEDLRESLAAEGCLLLQAHVRQGCLELQLTMLHDFNNCHELAGAQAQGDLARSGGSAGGSAGGGGDGAGGLTPERVADKVAKLLALPPPPPGDDGVLKLMYNGRLVVLQYDPQRGSWVAAADPDAAAQPPTVVSCQPRIVTTTSAGHGGPVTLHVTVSGLSQPALTSSSLVIACAASTLQAAVRPLSLTPAADGGGGAPAGPGAVTAAQVLLPRSQLAAGLVLVAARNGAQGIVSEPRPLLAVDDEAVALEMEAAVSAWPAAMASELDQLLMDLGGWWDGVATLGRGAVGPKAPPAQGREPDSASRRELVEFGSHLLTYCCSCGWRATARRLLLDLLDRLGAPFRELSRDGRLLEAARESSSPSMIAEVSRWLELYGGGGSGIRRGGGRAAAVAAATGVVAAAQPPVPAVGGGVVQQRSEGRQQQLVVVAEHLQEEEEEEERQAEVAPAAQPLSQEEQQRPVVAQEAAEQPKPPAQELRHRLLHRATAAAHSADDDVSSGKSSCSSAASFGFSSARIRALGWHALLLCRGLDYDLLKARLAAQNEAKMVMFHAVSIGAVACFAARTCADWALPGVSGFLRLSPVRVQDVTISAWNAAVHMLALALRYVSRNQYRAHATHLSLACRMWTIANKILIAGGLLPTPVWVLNFHTNGLLLMQICLECYCSSAPLLPLLLPLFLLEMPVNVMFLSLLPEAAQPGWALRRSISILVLYVVVASLLQAYAQGVLVLRPAQQQQRPRRPRGAGRTVEAAAPQAVPAGRAAVAADPSDDD